MVSAQAIQPIEGKLAVDWFWTFKIFIMNSYLSLSPKHRGTIINHMLVYQNFANLILATKCVFFVLPEIDRCKEETHQCSANAECTNNAESYSCTCDAGFVGNGHDCTGSVSEVNTDICFKYLTNDV